MTAILPGVVVGGSDASARTPRYRRAAVHPAARATTTRAYFVVLDTPGTTTDEPPPGQQLNPIGIV